MVKQMKFQSLEGFKDRDSLKEKGGNTSSRWGRTKKDNESLGGFRRVERAKDSSKFWMLLEWTGV